MDEYRTAVVTGAGTGIGRATALALAQQGWNVAFVGRRKNLLDDAVAQAGGRGLAAPCDVSDPAAVDELFARVVELYGRVDLLFNNAGTSVKGATIDEVDPAGWDRVVAVNLTGSFLCARAAFRQMRRQAPQGGRIINNGSVSAYVPRPGSAPYTATKHAITGLTRTIALDGRPFDVACGQIDIGNALTEMAASMTKGVPQPNGTTAAEATMDPRHVADAVCHMASLPLEANILFMTVMATKMPFIGRG